MQDRLEIDLSNCSIARTLDLLGEKWTFLILREAWFGVSRFGDFERALNCARNLLAERLHMLVREGVLETRPYQEPGSRTRLHYVLTDKGKQIVPALLALREWGDRYLSDPDGPPTYVHHRSCGQRVSVEMRCAAGHHIDSADDLEPADGPGLRLVSN